MNAGMLLAELAQKPRQHILGDGRRSSKGKLPSVVTSEGYNLALYLNEKRIDLLRVPEEYRTGQRQRDLRPSAIKHLNTKFLLKRLDLEAYRRLSEVQFFGGFAEAELFGNCPEDHNTKVFETRHSTIRTPPYGGRENRRRFLAVHSI
jgi:hypothetical protein